jgi:hypothetical protein
MLSAGQVITNPCMHSSDENGSWMEVVADSSCSCLLAGRSGVGRDTRHGRSAALLAVLSQSVKQFTSHLSILYRYIPRTAPTTANSAQRSHKHRSVPHVLRTPDRLARAAKYNGEVYGGRLCRFVRVRPSPPLQPARRTGPSTRVVRRSPFSRIGSSLRSPGPLPSSHLPSPSAAAAPGAHCEIECRQRMCYACAMPSAPSSYGNAVRGMAPLIEYRSATAACCSRVPQRAVAATAAQPNSQTPIRARPRVLAFAVLG